MPWPLVPTYIMMRSALFPEPELVARPVLALAVPGLYPSGTFIHIREDRTHELPALLSDPATWAWLSRHSAAALTAAGYPVSEEQLPGGRTL